MDEIDFSRLPLLLKLRIYIKY
jgi:hypothetical protein